MAKLRPNTKQFIFEVIGLQTARGRLIFLGAASLIIYILPIRVLAGLSLWEKLAIDAPSIGLTRAYHYILHGDIGRAWDQNIGIFLVLAVGIPLIAKDVYNVIKQLMLRSHYGRPKQ